MGFKTTLKNKAISLLATICIMETVQIMFDTPWTVIEAVPTGCFLLWLIHYFIQELEDLEGRKMFDRKTVAETVLKMAEVTGKSIKEVWEGWIHEIIKEGHSLEEIKEYIKNKKK